MPISSKQIAMAGFPETSSQNPHSKYSGKLLAMGVLCYISLSFTDKISSKKEG